jgi:hypothetical protein
MTGPLTLTGGRVQSPYLRVIGNVTANASGSGATIGAGTIDWQRFGDGLPPVIVTRLAYNAAGQQLLAATYGRGAFAISTRFAR